MSRQRVAVAMSGGVDSSVAAALLVEQGQEVVGLMLRLWSPDPRGLNRCCSPDALATARRVAAMLDIPFHVLDVRAPFKAQVVDFFVEGYRQGVTPNPCLECNRHIRWGFLLRHALALGATHLATGHYARVRQREDGRYLLLRAMDRAKDQSYVLSVMTQENLRHACFPIGDYTKEEVRAMAAERGLPVAQRRESQDLCFVTDGDYQAFLESQGVRLSPGPIVDVEGRTLGEHRGLAAYTIGQRKSIGISAPEPLYVVAKDMARNALIVGPRTALERRTFHVGRVNWVLGEPPDGPVEVGVQVRYRAREVPATVTATGEAQAEVELAEPLPDVTPGQAAVFYQGEVCLGGGIIQP